MTQHGGELGPSHLTGIRTSGAMFLSFGAACEQLEVALDGEAMRFLADVSPAASYPLASFHSIYARVVASAADPEALQEAIGVEMMRAWYRFGPGRSLIRRGLDFLYFQTGSEGYRSVMMGPEKLVGSFQLESVDLAHGRAVVKSTTPLWRAMERGVLRGGMELVGDIENVAVVQDGDTFSITFERASHNRSAARMLRYCPLCDARSTATACDVHRLSTVDVGALVFQQQLEPGYILGGSHRIDALIGQGGMGVVYRAHQLTMGRDVALKTLRSDGPIGEATLRRFYREAHAASRLDHRNIVRVFDFGVDEASSTPFITMELVAGQSMKRFIAQRGPLPPMLVAELGAQVADALAAAHAAGVVHRDVKPGNIVVTPSADGGIEAKVVDFGLASVMSLPDLALDDGAAGTPRYMSPEQILGKASDWPSDLYSLGLTLSEALLGEPPFADAPDRAAMIVRQLEGEVPDLSHIDSPDLVRIVHQMLCADPERRAKTTAQLASALRAIAQNCPVPWDHRAPAFTARDADASETLARLG